MVKNMNGNFTSFVIASFYLQWIQEMGAEAKNIRTKKVLILASYPTISGTSQNKIQGIEKL